MLKRGVAICHYNRLDMLPDIVEAVKKTTPSGTKIIVCDDGSDRPIDAKDVILIKGPNLGVAANKNRALWALQDYHYIAILEDDIMPKEGGWFEDYEKASQLADCHHFCRVQDKEVDETIPAFSAFLGEHGLSPIYGPSPRGDFTFLTSKVVRNIGAFNPRFRGAGYAHGEWSERVARAGLVGHPLKWVDIRECRDKFIQVGDTEGGRWLEDESAIKKQLQANRRVKKELEKTDYSFHPLVLE